VKPEESPTHTSRRESASGPAAPIQPADARRLQLRDLVPLAGFVVPTVVMGYGFVIPRSSIAGVNQLTVGFGVTIVAACVTYVMGVRAALRRA
jgi:hypothetical protein